MHLRLTALSPVPRIPGSRGRQVSLPFHSGFSPDAPVFTVWEHPEGKHSPRKCFSMKWCGKLPWIWRLRGWGCVSFPKFSPFYTLLSWPRVKAHPLRQGRGSHMGAAPRPSDCDGRSLQTTSQGLDVLAWLSYPEPAKLQNLDLQNVIHKPSKHQEAGIAFPVLERKSRNPERRRGLPRIYSKLSWAPPLGAPPLGSHC